MAESAESDRVLQVVPGEPAEGVLREQPGHDDAKSGGLVHGVAPGLQEADGGHHGSQDALGLEDLVGDVASRLRLDLVVAADRAD